MDEFFDKDAVYMVFQNLVEKRRSLDPGGKIRETNKLIATEGPCFIFQPQSVASIKRNNTEYISELIASGNLFFGPVFFRGNLWYCCGTKEEGAQWKRGDVQIHPEGWKVEVDDIRKSLLPEEVYEYVQAHSNIKNRVIFLHELEEFSKLAWNHLCGSSNEKFLALAKQKAMLTEEIDKIYNSRFLIRRNSNSNTSFLYEREEMKLIALQGIEKSDSIFKICVTKSYFDYTKSLLELIIASANGKAI
jgi:hypothetical protein